MTDAYYSNLRAKGMKNPKPLQVANCDGKLSFGGIVYQIVYLYGPRRKLRRRSLPLVFDLYLNVRSHDFAHEFICSCFCH